MKKYSTIFCEIERGPRYLINDTDPKKPGRRAFGVNLDRDQGFVNQNWSDINL